MRLSACSGKEPTPPYTYFLRTIQMFSRYKVLVHRNSKRITTLTYAYTNTELKHQAVEKASKDSLVTDIMDNASIWKSQDIYATLSSDKLKIFHFNILIILEYCYYDIKNNAYF